METSKVRTDYEQLSAIARVFGQQAEAVQGLLGRLEKAKGVLEGGKWKGKGSAAFYREVNQVVLPATGRLVAALHEAASTTRKMSQIMKQAEEAASRVLNGNGVNAAAQAGQGETAGGGSREASAETVEEKSKGAGGAQAAPSQAAGAGGPGTGSAAPSKQTPAQAAEAELNKNGITISSSGNCRDASNPKCTSLDGMRQQTIDGIIDFRKAVGKDLVITGGTEKGHSTKGQYRHDNGYKVDIRPTTDIDDYIKKTYKYVGDRQGDKAPMYEDANGNVYAREKDHWDITYK